MDDENDEIRYSVWVKIDGEKVDGALVPTMNSFKVHIGRVLYSISELNLRSTIAILLAIVSVILSIVLHAIS